MLFLDSPSSQRTGGSTLRVKVQVDLTKTRPSYVWLFSKTVTPIKDGGWKFNMRESQTTACTASIWGLWNRNVQLRGGMKKLGKRRNGKLKANPRKIRNRGFSSRFKDMAQVTLSSMQELRIKKTQVKRKNSSTLLYTMNQWINKRNNAIHKKRGNKKIKIKQPPRKIEDLSHFLNKEAVAATNRSRKQQVQLNFRLKIFLLTLICRNSRR